MADRFLQYSPPPVRDAVVSMKRGGLLTVAWERWFWRLEDMLYKRPSCHLSNTAAQTTSTSVWFDASFDTEEFDNATMHSLTTNPDRMTIQEDGLYAFGGHAIWDNNVTGLRSIAIVLNDPAPWANSARLVTDTVEASAAYPGVRMACSGTAEFSAGDVLRLSVLQISGGDLDVLGTTAQGPAGIGFWCHKVSSS